MAPSVSHKQFNSQLGTSSFGSVVHFIEPAGIVKIYQQLIKIITRDLFHASTRVSCSATGPRVQATCLHTVYLCFVSAYVNMCRSSAAVKLLASESDGRGFESRRQLFFFFSFFFFFFFFFFPIFILQIS